MRYCFALLAFMGKIDIFFSLDPSKDDRNRRDLLIWWKQNVVPFDASFIQNLNKS